MNTLCQRLAKTFPGTQRPPSLDKLVHPKKVLSLLTAHHIADHILPLELKEEIFNQPVRLISSLSIGMSANERIVLRSWREESQAARVYDAVFEIALLGGEDNGIKARWRFNPYYMNNPQEAPKFLAVQPLCDFQLNRSSFERILMNMASRKGQTIVRENEVEDLPKHYPQVEPKMSFFVFRQLFGF